MLTDFGESKFFKKWKMLTMHVPPAGGSGHPAGGGEAGKDQGCAEGTARSSLQVETSAGQREPLKLKSSAA